MHEGRRNKLRMRILKFGISSLTDKEIIEYLLYAFIARQDTTPIAEKLLEKFGCLDGVLNASVDALESVEGMPKIAAVFFAQLRRIVNVSEARSVKGTVIINNAEEAGKYICSLIGEEKVEVAVALFLNNGGKVICSQTLNSGSPNEVNMKAREITSTALNANASYVILGHNHPSGGLTPSTEDILTTQSINEVLKHLSIRLVDHLIVGGKNYCSLARSGFFNENSIGVLKETDGIYDIGTQEEE